MATSKIERVEVVKLVGINDARIARLSNGTSWPWPWAEKDGHDVSWRARYQQENLDRGALLHLSDIAVAYGELILKPAKDANAYIAALHRFSQKVDSK
jgi:hypothetical protein